MKSMIEEGDFLLSDRDIEKIVSLSADIYEDLYEDRHVKDAVDVDYADKFLRKNTEIFRRMVEYRQDAYTSDREIVSAVTAIKRYTARLKRKDEKNVACCQGTC